MLTVRNCRLPSLLAVVLPLAGCQIDSTGSSAEASALGPVASHRAADDPPQFSDWSAPVPLGSVVNSDSVDNDVSVSRDGRSLYFASNRAGGFGGFDIWVAKRARRDAPWGAPQNLGPTINTSANEQGAALTRNGRQLFFFSDRVGGFGGSDVYVSERRSKRDDFGWQSPVNLGSGVNTMFNDNLPHPFKDRESGAVTLYFNSNRPAGVPGSGQTDIYASTLQADNTFGAAVLVPELMSPLRDAGMAIRRDGLEMILASDRAGTFGSFDLWVTTRASTLDPWSTPVNLGPVVNSATGEGRMALSNDGTALYIINHPVDPLRADISLSTRSRIRVDDSDQDQGSDDDDDDRDHRRERDHRN